MFYIALFALAAAAILSSRGVAAAHQFTDAIRRDSLDVRKYGVTRNPASWCRGEMFQPRENIYKNGFRSLTRYAYDCASGESLKVSYEEYDGRGRTTRFLEFDRDGAIVQTLVYNYDSAGRIAEAVEYTPAGNVSERSTYKYDDRGELAEYARFGRGGRARLRVDYSRNGDAVSEVTHSYADGTVEEAVYEYSNGLLARKRYGAPNGGRIVERYDYDGGGRLAEVDALDEEGSAVFRWTCEYDGAGMPVGIVIENRETGGVTTKRMAYDENGELTRLSEETSGPGPDLFFAHAFERDEEGSLSVKLFKGGAARPAEIYRYDRNGCLVESGTFADDGSLEKVIKHSYAKTYTENAPEDPADFLSEANIKNECVRNMRAIAGAIDMFAMENEGRFPAGFDEMAAHLSDSAVPECPKKGRYSFDRNADGLLSVECSEHGSLY